MRTPTFAEAMGTAMGLRVLDQETGTLVPFALNAEQQEILHALCSVRRLVVLKGRQLGCSTVVALFVMCMAMMNPGLPCAIVADDHAKAKGLLAKVTAWVTQIPATKLVVNQKESITLSNGAVIDALTAKSSASDAGGESKTGRSKTYAVVHATEMAFWSNASSVWASLTSTETQNSVYIVESTGVPGDGLFRQVFDGAEKDGWTPLFFGVEQHENYRADPASISDEQYETLQEAYGFTRRDSAAWWWAKLWRDFKGDVPRMLREYPVQPEHSFTFREGLHITGFKEVDVIEDGDWNLYAPLEEILKRPVVMGVDTSEGIELDSSALGGVDHETGEVLFTWKNNNTPITTFIALVRQQIARFKPVATPIEKNGVGAVVFQALEGTRGVIEHVSGAPKGEVKKRRDDLRDAIVTGEVPIGGHLVAEAKSSTVKAKARKDGTVKVMFVGMDDALSAVSFARKWRDANKWRPPVPPPLNPRTHVDRTAYRYRRGRKGVF